MALLKYGPLAAAVSGTIGGTVFSRNRGGAYSRTWAKPHVVSSDAAVQAKSLLSICSRAWAGLTDAQRLAWQQYCTENPSLNRLGDSHTLAGSQAYNALNTRILRMGASAINVPPMVAPPDAVSISSFSVDISDTAAEVAFATSPLATGHFLWVWAAVTSSPGVKFVANRLRLVAIGASAQTTPLDIYDDLLDRFGDLMPNQVVHIRVQVASSITGLVSGFATAKATVTS